MIPAFALAPFTGVEKELDEVLNFRSVYISSATLGMYNSGSVSSIHHQLDTFIRLHLFVHWLIYAFSTEARIRSLLEYCE